MHVSLGRIRAHAYAADRDTSKLLLGVPACSVIPQVLQNHAFIQAGQLSALAAISWVGWCAGLAGNALMCTYLASKKEAAAVRVQLIGIASNLVVLGQLWWAHVMPTNAFAGALCASLAIAVGGVLRSTGRMSERQWLPFEALVGAAGVAAAPQVSTESHVAWASWHKAWQLSCVPTSTLALFCFCGSTPVTHTLHLCSLRPPCRSSGQQ